MPENINASDIYEVNVKNIFEGPMDLLIFLIKKNEVDIYDIPISLITDQYLEYMEWMQAMDIDFAGDFLVMASTLTQIKSKMLLPSHENEDEDDEDPRLEITRPLLEYLRMKSVAERLHERNLLGEDTFLREPPAEEWAIDKREDELIKIGLFELIDAFQNVLRQVPEEHRINLDNDRISIKERITQLIDVLDIKSAVTFHEILGEAPEKEDIVITFLAILEMARLNLIRVTQHVQSGMIRLFYI